MNAEYVVSMTMVYTDTPALPNVALHLNIDLDMTILKNRIRVPKSQQVNVEDRINNVESAKMSANFGGNIC